MILVEIAYGAPPAPREQISGDLALLKRAHPASFTEVIAFIEREKLYGMGCGFVDIALLAGACITPSTKIRTLEKAHESCATVRCGACSAIALTRAEDHRESSATDDTFTL
ncbi:MAG: hypothetical protein EAZ43_10470 [Betaproteobacteria bacterium]|nr:MAG: hypothetical protein EAZ43_10470 [Betaproteobacteria bacterium]